MPLRVRQAHRVDQLDVRSRRGRPQRACAPRAPRRSARRPHERVERRHRLLEDHRDAGCRGAARIRAGGSGSRSRPRTRCCRRTTCSGARQQAHDRARSDRLARTDLADDAQDLAGRERRGDVLDRVRAVRPRRQRDVGCGRQERASSSRRAQSGIERVVQALADEVDRQHCQQDRDAGKGAHPPGDADHACVRRRS